MKALGSDIVAFFNSEWPEDDYVDECSLSVDGEKIVKEDGTGDFPLSEKYELQSFGEIYRENSDHVRSLDSAFRKWAKARTTVTMIVEVPKDKEEDIRAILRNAGVVTK